MCRVAETAYCWPVTSYSSVIHISRLKRRNGEWLQHPVQFQSNMSGWGSGADPGFICTVWSHRKWSELSTHLDCKQSWCTGANIRMSWKCVTVLCGHHLAPRSRSVSLEEHRARSPGGINTHSQTGFCSDLESLTGRRRDWRLLSTFDFGTKKWIDPLIKLTAAIHSGDLDCWLFMYCVDLLTGGKNVLYAMNVQSREGRERSGVSGE